MIPNDNDVAQAKSLIEAVLNETPQMNIQRKENLNDTIQKEFIAWVQSAQNSDFKCFIS